MNKNLEKIERAINKTHVMVSNQIKQLKMTGITQATPFSSLLWRCILRNNMQGITKVELEYQSDVVREETRILVEDIGLTDLENLQELTLHMNKGYLLADLCHYFQNSTTLTSLNLSNNNLQSSQCQ